jgi:site-specific DNA-methyltransferase (adenine-specific)
MLGDNIESLKKLPDNSIDSIVTDAPYGLGKEQDMNIVLKDWIEKGYSEIKGKGFMGKEWDAYVPQPAFWKEVYRVLKPGGHILCFFGTRTYDIGTMAIRLAGFEIRDQIQWIYSTGFPKSLNIGKAFDKKNGNEREVVGETAPRGGAIHGGGQSVGIPDIVTKGSSQYEGWGTALKPANEPICLARKPLSEKTIVDNVIKWGTGGINVDGCRIEIDGVDDRSAGIRTANFGSMDYQSGGNGTEPYEPNEGGRFPANILFDEEAAQVLDEQSGVSKSSKSNKVYDNELYDDISVNVGGGQRNPESTYADKGGASRFFYVAKVGKKERNLGLDNFEDKVSQLNSGGIGRKISVEKRLEENGENAPTMKNTHPTLKPINLMNYLCRLITPPGGIVLDPFMGSGSTGISACLEGFRFVGMELDEDYFKIAEARVNNFEEYRKLLK